MNKDDSIKNKEDYVAQRINRLVKNIDNKDHQAAYNELQPFLDSIETKQPFHIIDFCKEVHRLVALYLQPGTNDNTNSENISSFEQPYYAILKHPFFETLTTEQKLQFYQDAASTLLACLYKPAHESGVFYLTAALALTDKLITSTASNTASQKIWLEKQALLQAQYIKFETLLAYDYFLEQLGQQQALAIETEEKLEAFSQHIIKLADNLCSIDREDTVQRLFQSAPIKAWNKAYQTHCSDKAEEALLAIQKENNEAHFCKIFTSIFEFAQSLQRHRQYETARAYYKQLIEKFKRIKNPSEPVRELHTSIDRAEAIYDQPLKRTYLAPTSTTLEYRTQLQNLRLALQSGLDADQAVASCQQSYSLGVKTLIGSIAADVVKHLGEPPCAFSLIGMGSLSRLELAPYSDIDIAILIENAEACKHPYFQAFIGLLNSYLNLLGDIWEFDEKSNNKLSLGLHIDTGDIQHLQSGELIKNPSAMAKYVTDALIKTTHLDGAGGTKFNLVYSLQSPCLIYNSAKDSNLLQIYYSALTQCYKLKYTEQQKPYYQQIAHNSLYLHQEEFEETWQYLHKRPFTLDIKRHLLAPLTYWCLDVALYQGLLPENLADIANTKMPTMLQTAPITAINSSVAFLLEQLVDKKLLESSVANTISRVHNQLEHVRLQQHSKAGKKVDILEASIITDKLCKLIYSILLPLHYSIADKNKVNKAPVSTVDSPVVDLANPLQAHPRKGKEVIFNITAPVFNPLNHALEKLINRYKAHSKTAVITEEDRTLIRGLFSGLAYALVEEQAAAAIFQQHYEQLPEVLRPLFLSCVENALNKQPLSYTPSICNTLYVLPDSDGFRPLMARQVIQWRYALRSLFNEVDLKVNNTTYLETSNDNNQTILLFSQDLEQPHSFKPKCYELKPEVTKQLVDKNKRFLPKPIGQPGRHTVLPLQHEGKLFWAKILPEQPGVEYMIEQLAWRISAGGVPHSTLWKVCTGKQPLAVQVFSAIPGIKTIDPKEILTHTLEYTLENTPERLARISQKSFTQTLLRILLTNPEDDKGDDYFLVPEDNQYDNTIYSLWRIDNERAYYHPDQEEEGLAATFKKKAGFTPSRTLQVKSIIYCLDQMTQPLDKETIYDFLKLDPYLLLKSWLEDLKLQHDHYSQLFNVQGDVPYHLQIQEPGPGLLTVAVGQGLVSELFNRLSSMQTVLRLIENSEHTMNGLRLLETIQPRLASYYHEVFKKIPVQGNLSQNALNRFNQLTAGLYQEVKGYRQTGLQGLEAISKSLRLPALDTSLAIGIAKNEKHSPRWGLKELKALNQERGISIRDQLLAGLPSSIQAFKDLNVRSQLIIARDILHALDDKHDYFKHECLPPTAKNDQLKEKPTLEQQKWILQAMAGIPFHVLSLTPFRGSLTDGFLQSILQGAGQQLLNLDLSHCSQITNRTVQAIITHCPNLQFLTLAFLNNSKNKIIAIEGTFLHLTILKTHDCPQLQKIEITSPQLVGLFSQNCVNLIRVRVESDLHIRCDFSGCNNLARELDLSSQELDSIAISILARRLKRDIALTTLSLQKSQIKQNDVLKFTDALKNNYTLTNLNLDECFLGDEGLIALGEALAEDFNLITLNLSDLCYSNDAVRLASINQDNENVESSTLKYSDKAKSIFSNNLQKFQHRYYQLGHLKNIEEGITLPNNKYIKGCILGPCGSGKYKLLRGIAKYTGNYDGIAKYTENYNIKGTIGAVFYTFRFVLKETTVKLDLWDTAGLERYHSLASMYYRCSDVYILCFSLTDHEKFDRARSWVKIIKKGARPDAIISLVGITTKGLPSTILPEEITAYVEQNNIQYFGFYKDTDDLSEYLNSIATKSLSSDNKIQENQIISGVYTRNLLELSMFNILEQGAYSNNVSLLFLRDHTDKTIFHLAAQHGQIKTLTWLKQLAIKHKLINYYNMRDNEGNTPLHLAVQSNHVNVIHYLIQEGADPNVLNYKGRAALSKLERYQYLPSKSVTSLLQVIEKSITLTQLDLHKSIFGADDVKMLMQLLEQNNTLTRIDLQDNKLGVEEMTILGDVLQNNTILTQLDLSGNNLGVEGAKVLLKMMEKNTALTQLDINNNNFGVEEEKVKGLITAYLARNKIIKQPNLTHLDLQDNNLGTEGIKVLTHALISNSNLSQLNLSWNNLDAAAANLLALILGKHNNITQLNLSWNKLGNEGAKILAQVILNNDNLKKLDLRGNNISVGGSQELARALERNISLTQLDLRNNNLGFEENILLDKILNLLQRNQQHLARIKEAQLSTSLEQAPQHQSACSPERSPNATQLSFFSLASSQTAAGSSSSNSQTQIASNNTLT